MVLLTPSTMSATYLIFQNEVTFDKKFNLPFIYKVGTILKSTVFLKIVQKLLSVLKLWPEIFRHLHKLLKRLWEALMPSSTRRRFENHSVFFKIALLTNYLFFFN